LVLNVGNKFFDWHAFDGCPVQIDWHADHAKGSKRAQVDVNW